MRLLHAILLLPLFAAPALAETVPPPAAEHQGRRSAEQHFADANTTHDGRLTLDQATAGYKSVAKSFARIDINHRGYITMDDLKAWKAAKKAARQAAKRAADGTSPGRPATWNWDSPEVSGSSADRMAPTPAQMPRTGVDLPTAPLDQGRAS